MRASLRAPAVRACALAAGITLLGGASAQAAEQVSASKAAERSCQRYRGDTASTDVTRATARSTGLVQARLAGKGDWDLAVFDAKTRRVVAGSAALRSNELAEGFVRKGQALLVQACRFRGAASTATLSVSYVAVGTARAAADDGKVQVVKVKTPDRSAKERLQDLDLDLTEHGGERFLEVVLHGRADKKKLDDAGFAYTVEIADLAARTEANRKADRRFEAEVEQTALPSGRTSYRHLADYETEMKLLALEYPGMVRPFTLPNKSVLGRDVTGIEIARNAADLNDGKPIFLNMGVHHAREWPASEHSMEWAYDLLRNYGRSGRTTRLVDATRNIVIPVVNVDGFNISREAAPRGDFSLFDYEMKRKNCKISENTPTQYRAGTCDANPAGRLRGTDPNRNYGGFWGGPGASTNWSSDTYRGDAPFSEPEVRNIRELQATRTITNLITNHTYSNLVLRPPGVADVGFPLDEPVYKALGERMAGHNGYSNIPSFGLYDTTGSTEDWTFWTAGSLGFTFEIGPDEFHPPFEQGVVDEYLGRGDTAGAGQGGNREAYYEMLQSTADTALHSRITGVAKPGSTLKISKTFQTSTSPVLQPDGTTGDPQQFEDTLSYTLQPKGKRFDWAVNPSTRPVVAGRFGRDAVADPQAPITLANPDGIPAENTGDPESGPHEEATFTVGGPPEVDNGKMTVHMEWASTSTDWDLYILNEAGDTVSQSAAGGTNQENAVLFDPPPGTYRAIFVNYDGGATDDWSGGSVAFESPRPTTYGEKEAWTLTCTSADGTQSRPLQVFVDRGQRREVGNACKKDKKDKKD